MMKASITFTIPNSLWISSNDRLHYYTRASRVKHLRHLARVQARNTDLPKALNWCRIVAHIAYSKPTKADPANAYPTLKALVDGLVDYGLVKDDDSEHVEGPHMLKDKTLAPAKTHLVRFDITDEKNGGGYLG